MSAAGQPSPTPAAAPACPSAPAPASALPPAPVGADINKTFVEVWYADIPQEDGTTKRSCWISQADAQAFQQQNPAVPVTAAIGMCDNGPYNGYIHEVLLLNGTPQAINGNQLYVPSDGSE